MRSLGIEPFLSRGPPTCTVAWSLWIIACIVTAWWSLLSSYCYITLRLCPLTVNPSKLSPCYTWQFLNDKLSIRHNVLTMCFSPLHQFVILSAFSDAPCACERLKLSFRPSFGFVKDYPARYLWLGFLTRFLVWQLATLIIATLAWLVNLLSSVKISLANPPRSAGIMNGDHHDPSGSKRFINHRDPSG